MATTRAEVNIKRIERHVDVTDWGVPHEEVQTAIAESKREYAQLTSNAADGPVPSDAIRVVPANGKIIVVFSIESRG